MKKLEYTQLIDLLADKLSEEKNIKTFCETHKLNYNVVCSISRKEIKTHYPRLVMRMLEIYGYTVKKDIIYTLIKN